MPSFPSGESDATAVATRLAAEFAETAVERDRRGGTAKAERDRLRESGLLNLIIPREYGGPGRAWPEVMESVRILARVDSSLAHLFGFQHLMLATIDLFGDEAQRARYFRDTVEHSWFWGNALNPLDSGTTVTREGNRLLLHGLKRFSSGSVDANALIISGSEPGNPRLLVAAVPLPREGIVIHGDWDNIGQRQTDSGSVEFRKVALEDHELLRTPGPFGSVRAGLRPCIAQLIFANVFLGLGEGALEEARRHTRTLTRPWLTSGVAAPQEDPYVLHHFGEWWAGLEAARLVTDRAAASLQSAWEAGNAITEADRGAVAVDIATAKALTTRTGLAIAGGMFEVMGARATAARYGYDRFWRNLRTQTLHDPVDYKFRELGDWALNGRHPTPTFYS